MRSWWFGLLLGLAGCGQSGSSESEKPTGSYAAFGEELAAAYCEELAKCCGADFSASRCASTFGLTIRVNALAARESLFTFRADKAEQCLAELRTLGVCGLEDDLPAVCYEVTEGTLGGEESCNADAECASTTVSHGSCVGNGDGSSTCWTPVRLVGEGEACVDTCDAPDCHGSEGSVEDECDYDGGFFCNSGSVCQARIGLGESCTFSRSCEGDGLCDAGVCVSHGAGTACVSFLDCSDDHYCTTGRSCAVRLPVGAACDPNQIGACRIQCGESGTCDSLAHAFCDVVAEPP